MPIKVNKMYDPLPPFYYYFFWLFEPSLTFIGAIYAIFRPEAYGLDLLPEKVERLTKVIGATTRGQMVIGGLGSCFLLLCMLSLSLFPAVKHHLANQIDIQEKMVKAILIPLAIADITHIVMTLLPLPMSLLKTPSRWTSLINGNVWITVGLFLVRLSWFLGIGRSPHSPKLSPPSSTSETSRINASIPLTQSTVITEKNAGLQSPPSPTHSASSLISVSRATRSRAGGKRGAKKGLDTDGEVSS